MRLVARLGLLLALPLLVAVHPPPVSGIVTGTVTDAATGEALPGVNALLAGTALGAATGVDGRFEIADVPAGTYDLRVSFVGYAPQTLSIEVADGARLEVDVEMKAREALDEVVVTGEAASVGDVAESAGLRPRGSLGGMTLSRDAAGADYSVAPPPAAAPARPRPEAVPRHDVTPIEPQRAGVLTAGDIDDGLNWDAYLGYVRRTLGGDRPTHRQRRSNGDAYPDLGLDDRVTLRVVDEAGHPVAGARVTVTGEGGSRARRLVTEAGTDGRLALFPRYDFGEGVRTLRLDVRRPGGGGRAVTETVRLRRLGEDRAVRVRLPIRRAERPRALDLAFVIDVTGSMSDELRYLTDEFEAIVARVEDRYPGVDLRFGLIAYRDRGDQFVVRRHDFTRSAQEMQRRLSALRAQGGGDYPEAMDEALESALDLDWRTGSAARVAFLVADAPPHADRVGRTMDAVREARARGLRLYPVAASGVGDAAEYVMRAAAVLTQGRHLFLTDDSGVGLPHAEPKIGCYQVTRLDHLLVRVVASELEGRRVEAFPDEVIREVGGQRAGVCEPREVAQQRPVADGQRADGELGYDE
ncbi:MAG: carboxypeptidase-like regulatory domain-containing protein [Bacteroidota bacterium]